MIIECEKCASKFNLDETLLKSGGSKVKCSMCKHIFIAYPGQQKITNEEPIQDKALDQDLKETLPLDSVNADFDLAFEKAIKEAETEEPVSEEIVPKEVTEEPEVEPDDDETVSPVKRRKSSKMFILVILIVLVIGVGGTVFYLSLRNSSEKQESSDPGVMRISFRSGSVNGSHVESNTAGQLFVIRGMVTNNYPEPRSYILLKGSIQDDKGKIVKTGMAYAGNVFSEKEIRETPLADLKKRQENRSGDEETNVNIPSGGTIPFMIIFEELPENIAELSVEAVSSEPGK